MEIRDAEKRHARDLAFLLNLAGDGISAYLWGREVKGGVSPLEVGAGHLAEEGVIFSYTNARVCMDGETVMGMILSFRQRDPCEAGDLGALPEVLKPLKELQSRTPGSWYINALATYEEHRGRGAGRALIDDAERRARASGCGKMSLIVGSENLKAKKLYDSLGFNPAASLAVVPCPGGPQGGEWILMEKPL